MPPTKNTKSISHVHKLHLQIIVFEVVQLKFILFFETKDGMVESRCKLILRWKQSGHAADIVHLDNVGENILFQNQVNSAL